MYDMAHEAASAEIMSYRACPREGGGDERCSTLLRPPTQRAHWHEKWRAIDAYLTEIRDILTRAGDETVGEMWSLLDGGDDPCGRNRSAITAPMWLAAANRSAVVHWMGVQRLSRYRAGARGPRRYPRQRRRSGAGSRPALFTALDQKPRSVANAAASISARRSTPSRNIDSASTALAA